MSKTQSVLRQLSLEGRCRTAPGRCDRGRASPHSFGDAVEEEGLLLSGPGHAHREVFEPYLSEDRKAMRGLRRGLGTHVGLVSWVDARSGKDSDPITKGWSATLGA